MNKYILRNLVISEIFKLKRRSNIIWLLLLSYFILNNGLIAIYKPGNVDIRSIESYFYQIIFLNKGVNLIVLFTSVFIALSMSQDIFEKSYIYILINLKHGYVYYFTKIFMGIIIFSFFLLILVFSFVFWIKVSGNNPLIFISNFKLIDIINIYLFSLFYIILSLIFSFICKNPVKSIPVIIGVFMFEKLLIFLFNNYGNSNISIFLPHELFSSSLTYFTFDFLQNILKLVYLGVCLFFFLVIVSNKKILQE